MKACYKCDIETPEKRNPYCHVDCKLYLDEKSENDAIIKCKCEENNKYYDYIRFNKNRRVRAKRRLGGVYK